MLLHLKAKGGNQKTEYAVTVSPVFSERHFMSVCHFVTLHVWHAFCICYIGVLGTHEPTISVFG